MKRKSNLYDNIDLKYIEEIYFKGVRKNTKNKAKIKGFEDFFSVNISNIINVLKDENYIPSKYNIFLIKDPKYRIIMSQNISDKLINHLVGNILIKVLEPTLINTNVATRKNKGTHYGIKYTKKYLNELKGKEIYALKFDISKYFYNIDHEILKKLYRRKIKDKRFLFLLDKIIDSTNEEYVNKEIIKLINKEIEKVMSSNITNKKEKINELEKIPLYEKGKGLPIGNLSSQILAIFYLNELDHFITEKLKVRYVRYMDDGVLLSNDKEYLKCCLKEIKKILKKYKLKLNNKTSILNVSKNGLDFLGFKFYVKNNKVILKVRNKTKRDFKRKIKLINKNKLKNSKEVLESYKGHFKWGNCYCLLKKSIGLKHKKISD